MKHAIKTLFLLEMERCENRNVVELTINMKDEYLIDTKLLDECIDEVTIPIKKRKLRNYFGTPVDIA
jgi:transcriptional accessory protein Tex/SPT6